MTKQNKKQDKYGQLFLKYIPLTPGPLVFVNEVYSEWAFRSSTDLEILRKNLIKKQNKTNNYKKLRAGSLLTVFNSITKGDVLWSGTISFSPMPNAKRHISTNGQVYYGTQKVLGASVKRLQEKIDPDKWASMFFSKSPAVLKQKDGTEIHGTLDAYYETGMEGVAWVLCAFDKEKHNLLNFIQNGDQLTVYSRVTNGNVYWQGKLDFQDIKNNKFAGRIKRRNFTDAADQQKLERAFAFSFPARLGR